MCYWTIFRFISFLDRRTKVVLVKYLDNFYVYIRNKLNRYKKSFAY